MQISKVIRKVCELNVLLNNYGLGKNMSIPLSLRALNPPAISVLWSPHEQLYGALVGDFKSSLCLKKDFEKLVYSLDLYFAADISLPFLPWKSHLWWTFDEDKCKAQRELFWGGGDPKRFCALLIPRDKGHLRTNAAFSMLLQSDWWWQAAKWCSNAEWIKKKVYEPWL